MSTDNNRKPLQQVQAELAREWDHYCAIHDLEYLRTMGTDDIEAEVNDPDSRLTPAEREYIRGYVERWILLIWREDQTALRDEWQDYLKDILHPLDTPADILASGLKLTAQQLKRVRWFHDAYDDDALAAEKAKRKATFGDCP